MQKRHNKTGITISVIVPTLNGEDTLEEFFAALKMQDIQPDEIIVGDSQSEDNTVAISRKMGASVVPIKRSFFDHGGTRTFLAQKACGDIVVFFTQDAILATQNSLMKIIDSLIKNDDIACAYGRQLPNKGATLLSAHLRKFNYPDLSVVRSFEDRKKYGLKTIFISNSFAAYKKEILAENGYFKNGLIFGEDTCTLGRLLQAGYRVAYVAEAGVYHSHNYRIVEDFKRSFDIGVLHSSEKWLLETYGDAIGVGGEYVRSALAEIVNEKKYWIIPDWLVRNGCKYIGYKLGRAYLKIPGKLRPGLSLHRFWWQKAREEM